MTRAEGGAVPAGQRPQTVAWLRPGRLMERIDDRTGRLTCQGCGLSTEFGRADGGPLSNASLTSAGVGWDHECEGAAS